LKINKILLLFIISIFFLTSCNFSPAKNDEQNKDIEPINTVASSPDNESNNSWQESLPEQVVKSVNENKENAEISEVKYEYTPTKLLWTENTEQADQILRIDVSTYSQKSDFTIINAIDSKGNIIFSTVTNIHAKIGLISLLGTNQNQIMIEEDVAGNGMTNRLIKIYSYGNNSMQLIFEECLENRAAFLSNYSCVNTIYYKKVPNQESFNIILKVRKYSDKESTEQFLEKTYDVEFQYNGEIFKSIKPYEPYRIKTSEEDDFDLIKENRNLITWQ